MLPVTYIVWLLDTIESSNMDIDLWYTSKCCTERPVIKCYSHKELISVGDWQQKFFSFWGGGGNVYKINWYWLN
jgi:hypothetical protein